MIYEAAEVDVVACRRQKFGTNLANAALCLCQSWGFEPGVHSSARDSPQPRAEHLESVI